MVSSGPHIESHLGLKIMHKSKLVCLLFSLPLLFSYLTFGVYDIHMCACVSGLSRLSDCAVLAVLQVNAGSGEESQVTRVTED